MKRVAIIGTAGRKEDGPLMSRVLFDKMLQAVRNKINEFIPAGELTLVSGGAAWADHVAVVLAGTGFRDASLELHLPASYQYGKFVEAGFQSPGKIANYYHRLMSTKMGYDTAAEIGKALNKLSSKAVITVSDGFFARNLKVTNVDLMIALTWGSGSVPKDGGTSHTWNAARCQKVHIPLGSL